MKTIDIYLAAPYKSDYKDIREKRMREVNRIAGTLIRNGNIVFSPLSHGDTICKQVSMKTDWNTWAKQNEAFIAVSKKLVILALPGWRESIGVREEMNLAEKYKIPIEIIPATFLPEQYEEGSRV